MASVYIRAREVSDGSKRWDVRYRIGGRAAPLKHGGSFRREAEASARADAIRHLMAAGLDPSSITTSHASAPTKSPRKKLEDATYVYVMTSRVGVKVGISSSPATRRRDLQNTSGLRVSIAALFPLPSRQIAEDVESRVHGLLDLHRLPAGEWFECDWRLVSSAVAESIPDA